MTQEEKAKAYDEALRKIRPLYERAKKEDCPIWSTYEYVFPELVENEDERIRKEIIEYLKLHDKGENDYAHAMFSKWFNWLEKKKDMDNSYTNVIFPFKAMVKENGKIVTILNGQLSSDNKYWEKYQSSSEDGYNVYNPDEIINIKETLSYPEKQKEQKPLAMAKIDTEKAVEILNKINVLMKIQHRSYLSNELEHIINFIESNTKNG